MCNNFFSGRNLVVLILWGGEFTNMKKLLTGLLSGSLFLVFSSLASAAINPDTLQASEKVGVIGNLGQMFVFAFNLLRYVGWAGVILGVGLAIFALIYKLFGTESEETMKTVSGYITKAVIIVICGILLLSAGFIIKTIAGLIGSNAVFEVPTEIGSAAEIGSAPLPDDCTQPPC